MFVQLAVIFAVVFSLADGQVHSGSTFCHEKFIKKIYAARKSNDRVDVGIDDHNKDFGKGNCTVHCKMTLSNEGRAPVTENHDYTAPDFTWCGPSDNFCHQGECVVKDFCREMMKKEFQAALDKKKFYPLVSQAYQLGKKENPCQIYCNLTTGQDEWEIKHFTAPDYAFCGIEFGPKGYLLNMCKAGKCVTPDGKMAKQPVPASVIKG